MTSITFLRQGHLLVSPRSTILPSYFSNCGSNSTFLGWQMSNHVAKWTFFFLSLRACSKTTSVALHIVQLPGWNRFENSQSLSTAAAASRIFIAGGIKNKLSNKGVMILLNWTLSPRSDFRVESYVYSWIREPPRCMHALSFGFCWNVRFRHRHHQLCDSVPHSPCGLLSWVE